VAAEETYELTVDDYKSPGTNGAYTLCGGTVLTEAILFNSLEGNPESGGSWSPAVGAVGTYTYTHAANGSCVAVSAQVVVDACPEAQDDDFSLCHGERIDADENLFADNGNGVDSDPDGDSFTITKVNGASGNVGSQITLDSGALLTVLADGTMSYDMNGNFVRGGTDTFTYILSDGVNESNEATVTITIYGKTSAIIGVQKN